MSAASGAGEGPLRGSHQNLGKAVGAHCTLRATESVLILVDTSCLNVAPNKSLVQTTLSRACSINAPLEFAPPPSNTPPVCRTK
jgi:hypothetical protein